MQIIQYNKERSYQMNLYAFMWLKLVRVMTHVDGLIQCFYIIIFVKSKSKP